MKLKAKSQTNGFKPHGAIEHRYQDESGKQAYLRQVFDRGAPYYEGILKWGFFGSGDWYRHDALKRNGLEKEMLLVDVASGSGTTAMAACKILARQDQITCVEPSRGMLAECKKNLPQAQHLLAGAEDMDLPDSTCDFLSMGFALRHVDNLLNAFKEYHRVLRSGGKVCILEISLPKGKLPRFFLKIYFDKILPMLSKLFTASDGASEMMRYYWESMDEMVDPQVVLTALTKAGFKNAKHKQQLHLFSEYTAEKI